MEQRIGPYEIVERLAIGGMAEVFLGLERGADGRLVPYAIKKLLPQVRDDSDVVRMLVDEARLSARMSHRGIARTVRAGRDEGEIYLAMEFVDGRDLGALLSTLRDARRLLDPQLAVLVVLRASEALDYAHRLVSSSGQPLKVVHRDVSPANIMLGYDGEVRVIDFGVARAEERLAKTQAGVVKGKYRYMAPEQALEQPVDHRADVYSLGVVLYEALAGQVLLPALGDVDVILAVLNAKVPPLRAVNPHVPPELARIVARAMEKDVSARYPSCADLSSDLRAWIARNAPPDLGPSHLAAVMVREFPDTAGRLRGLLAERQGR